MGRRRLFSAKPVDVWVTVDEQPQAPVTRRWRAVPRADLNRAPDAAWDENPWDHTRRRRRAFVIWAAIAGTVAVGALVAFSAVSAASNYAAGKKALTAGRYEEAADKLAAATILAVVPWSDASSLAEKARQLSAQAAAAAEKRQEIADQAGALFAQAVSALQTRRFGDAVRLFERVLVLDPDYPDAQARLTTAKGLRDAQLMSQARTAFGRGRWKLAVQRSEALLSIHPQYPGAAGLRDRAALRGRLEPIFDRARAQANAGRWARARALVTRVLRRDAQYPGARKLQARIKAALAAAAAARAPAPAASSAPAPAPPPPPAPNPTPPPP